MAKGRRRVWRVQLMWQGPDEGALRKNPEKSYCSNVEAPNVKVAITKASRDFARRGKAPGRSGYFIAGVKLETELDA